MQNELQQLIKKYEKDIDILVERKKLMSANDELFTILEITILQKQNICSDLRGIL